MNEIDNANFTDQSKFRLNKKAKVKLAKGKHAVKINKYVAAFHYTDKVLTVISATSGGVCIILSVSVAEAPIETAGASFTLFFSLTTGIMKKLLSITSKNKLNSIETLVPQALIGMEISPKEFIRILKEKDKYEKMKENLMGINEKIVNTKLNGVNSKA